MDTSLRIISWNLHGVPFITRHKHDRMVAVARRVLREDPDVVHFQEVWLRGDAELLVEWLSPSYLPAAGAPSGGLERQSGLLTFVKRRSVRLLEAPRFTPFEAHGPAWKIWEGDGLGGKGVDAMVVERGGARIALLNTHLQSPYTSNDYADVRRRQLAQLRDVAAAYEPQLPLIAVGDLNTNPSEPLDPQFGTFWIDLTEERRRQCGCGTHYDEHGADADWIDYVLARRSTAAGLEVDYVHRLENEAVDDPYSDHQGLEALIRFPVPDLAAVAVLALAMVASHQPQSRRACLARLAGVGAAMCGRLAWRLR